MYCHECGALLAPEDFFCGACGARVKNEDSRAFLVYSYDAAYAKARHASSSFGGQVARGLLYCLAPICLIFFGDMFFAWAMGLSFCGIAALVLECMFRRKYFLARQSAVVYDRSRGVTYYVTLFGNPSVGFSAATRAAAAAQNFENAAQQARLAQIERMVIHEVKRYQAGENRYNVWTGGPVRVIAMHRLERLRTAKRYTVYRYYDENERPKTIKLPDCFPGFQER